jgi:hypothetical protein
MAMRAVTESSAACRHAADPQKPAEQPAQPASVDQPQQRAHTRARPGSREEGDACGGLAPRLRSYSRGYSPLTTRRGCICPWLS